MHIIIGADGSVTLDQPADFTAFDIRAVESTQAAVLDALGDRGAAAPERDHIFVTVAAVRDLAGGAVDSAWEAGFEAMMGYAASKGWLDDAGSSIKAHIDPS
ncbi:MAG: hypothetical protein OEU32_00280 [Acidimicrobiia bacterium]|nr:hypothetical protein [Acidimicrobiia bacterium]